MKTISAALFCLALLLSGCGGSRASSDTDVAPAAPASTQRPPTAMKPGIFPDITLQQSDLISLSETLRRIGERYEGGFALVHGVGLQSVPMLDWKKKPYGEAMGELAAAAGAVAHKTEHYYFLYPAGYESLLSLSLATDAGQWPEPRISCAFGEGTNLYNVCNALSATVGRAIVPDNVIAETYCGELSLTGVPWWVALEAVLRSARIVPEMLQIDATQEYVFLGAGARPAADFLVHEETLSPEWRQRLEQVVSVRLPASSTAGVSTIPRAQSLRAVIGTLGRQMGVKLQAEPELLDIPINPVRMPDVRLRTALNLLIRQWPLPYFGYRAEGDSITLVKLRQGATIAPTAASQ